MNTVSMPVSRKAHQAQLPATPFLRTMSVTRLGVSAEKVVATMDMPNSHQGMLRPDRKYSEELLPARFETSNPIRRERRKKAMMMPQSSVEILMTGRFFVYGPKDKRIRFESAEKNGCVRVTTPVRGAGCDDLTT